MFSTGPGTQNGPGQEDFVTWSGGFNKGGVCVFKVGSPISVVIKTLTLYKLVLRPSCFQRDLSKELMG